MLTIPFATAADHLLPGLYRENIHYSRLPEEQGNPRNTTSRAILGKFIILTWRRGFFSGYFGEFLVHSFTIYSHTVVHAKVVPKSRN